MEEGLGKARRWDAWSCKRILMTSSGATVQRVRIPDTVPAAPCFHSAISAPRPPQLPPQLLCKESRFRRSLFLQLHASRSCHDKFRSLRPNERGVLVWIPDLIPDFDVFEVVGMEDGAKTISR